MKSHTKARVLLPALLASVVFAACSATGGDRLSAPEDPMKPVSSAEHAITSPIRLVTIATGSAEESGAFYEKGIGLESRGVPLSKTDMDKLDDHYDWASRGYTIFGKTALAEAAAVRSVEVDSSLPVLRPAYSSRFVGALGVGFPSSDLDVLTSTVEKHGFHSAVGVTRMNFPRADGSTYEVGEVHYKAPDDVLVLGVDRGTQAPVGPIDTESGAGGVAYASMLVDDVDKTGRFMSDVLGYEKRRAMTFNSKGPGGGMQDMRAGELVAFEQWFSPGSTTGYFVVMELLDGGKRALPQPAAGSRGVVGWTVLSRDLDDIKRRWKAYSGLDSIDEFQGNIPGLGLGRSIVIATPDGAPVEVVQLITVASTGEVAE